MFVRKSSSYYEGIKSLNETFKGRGLKPVRVVEADETLETEDIIEMVNSGDIRITVADSHLAQIWSKVFGNITIYSEIKISGTCGVRSGSGTRAPGLR